MSRLDLLALWSREVEGVALSAEERAALLRGLEQDAGLRQVALGDLAMDGMLRSRVFDAESGQRFTAGVTTLIAAQDDSGRFAERVQSRLGGTVRRRRVRRRMWSALALAAALAVAVGVGWMWRLAARAPAPDLPIAVVDAQPLRPGERVTLTERTALGWRDGSRAVAEPGTVLAVGDPTAGKRLELAAGSVHVTAAPQPAARPMTVSGPQATATVVGTEFTMAVEAGITRLAVSHGMVRFAAGTHGTGDGLLVGAGEAALADRFGVRAQGQPLFAWSAAHPQPIPEMGRIGAAPDGRPCLVAAPETGLVVISFTSPRGLFGFDPRAVVTCRVWISPGVSWAGFYFQDYERHHHGQWHLPLDRRGAWRELRFPLGEVEPIKDAPMVAGDAVHYFMLQAQFPPGAALYLDQLVVQPPGQPTPSAGNH